MNIQLSADFQPHPNRTSLRYARFSEIDIVRGVAILLMIVFHAGFDLDFYELRHFEMDAGIWLIMARTVQFIFILTTGMTLSIAYWKRHAKGSADSTWSRARHALKLLFWAMVITSVTWKLFGDQFVRFGILHFYAVSILLSIPLLRLRGWNAMLGLIVLGVSIPLSTLSTQSAWLFPFGITKPDFFSLDYFPLFPWFGLFLIGVALGGGFYQKHRPTIKLTLPPLEWLAQHSLVIYLIHQPLIVGLIQLFT